MASSVKWLELLEKEFDKAFVDLDLLLGEIDEDQCEITYEGRQKMTGLSSAFAQLFHKAQTMFENNSKTEADLAQLRQDLCETQASRIVLEKELQNLLLQLHAAQLQVTAQMGHVEDSRTIKKKLENEMEQYRKNSQREALLEAEVIQLRKENKELRSYIYSLQNELYGARLAAKYLDKELAGRIQQIQLLGRDLRGNDHVHLWNQLEAEIHLHRHKTVIKACRGHKDINKKLPYPPGHDIQSLKRKQGIGDRRVVHFTKGENEGLGISITGGKEHGVPILISDIHPGLPVAQNGGLFVGDAILTVNGIDLRNAKHSEAVKILSSQQKEITMEVIFVAPEDDSEESQDSDPLYR
ncbi:Golgi-associated PDZ and coiled-coil motif-containing protein-like [Centruroides sculpturatus]|uniref:Golgi-associated PDZ and coiled-coil motif-containing protein-like n=1 Tax=Centruroides sculpturatus TaxID=218467 RepID=UPI000C6EFF53|nr:Golgi-associated PDZ and coiled-coil motif-containing protein-like [Centruroides sculpturatus]